MVTTVCGVVAVLFCLYKMLTECGGGYLADDYAPVEEE